jgi:hypothetical protein
MKKFKTKVVLALAVLSMVGGVVLPVSQVKASTSASHAADANQRVSTRAWVGPVATYRSRSVDKFGRVTSDYWGLYQEVRCHNGYELVLDAYKKTDYSDGSYVEQWFYHVRTF